MAAYRWVYAANQLGAPPFVLSTGITVPFMGVTRISDGGQGWGVRRRRGT